jgi:hypothetical protein
MKPPTGTYKRIIGDAFPEIRLIFSDRPYSGVTIVSPGRVLSMLDKSNDEYAGWYADGIRDGRLLVAVISETISPAWQTQVWGPGELFLRS